MDEVDFGWEFGAVILLLYGLFYYIMLAVNYLLVITLGGQIKKITDRIVGEDKKSIFRTALPFLISSIIICLIFIILSFIPNINSPYNIPGKILIWVASICSYTGFIGYIIGMTCLSLTRYSFTTNWTVIGRLKGIKMVFNFILWTTIAIILTYVWNFLFSNWLFSFCLANRPLVLLMELANPLLAILMTYLFLKR
jgi:hypothetical protein